MILILACGSLFRRFCFSATILKRSPFLLLGCALLLSLVKLEPPYALLCCFPSLPSLLLNPSLLQAIPEVERTDGGHRPHPDD